MPLRAVVYVSDLVSSVDPALTQRLVEDAERFNRLAGVTGVLLFDGERFLQYFEGPEDGVEAVYARVQSSRSHQGLLELARGRIAQRLFPYWGMHLIPAAAMDTTQLVAASWTRIDVTSEEEQAGVAGIAALQTLVGRHLPPSELPRN